MKRIKMEQDVRKKEKKKERKKERKKNVLKRTNGGE